MAPETPKSPSNRNTATGLGLLAALLFISMLLMGLFSWQASQAAESSNLIANPAFAQTDLAEWQPVIDGAETRAVIIAAEPSQADAQQPVLRLSIPYSRIGNAAGVGQRVEVQPQQEYRAVVNYRLVQYIDPGLVELLLRVRQYDAAGSMLGQLDAADDRLLAMSPLDEQGQANWNSLVYSFETAETTAYIEIGIGIFGFGITTVEIDNFSLREISTAVATPTSTNWLFAGGLIIIILLIGGVALAMRASPAEKQPQRPLGRYLALIGVNLLLFCIFAEVAALGIYFVQQGQLFYTNRPTYELLADTAQGEMTRHRFHPYLGYIINPDFQPSPDEQRDEYNAAITPDRQWTVSHNNNYGFSSRYRYPYFKTAEEQYIIGIFGGSVAHLFSVQGSERMVSHLKQHPFFADKEPIVLNFGQGAYKQPQQLQALTYFMAAGQQFDMVINIDGFNEAALSSRNVREYGLDYLMPNGPSIFPLLNLIDQTTLTPRKLEALVMINWAKNRLNKTARFINSSPSAAVTFVAEQYYRYIFSQYQNEQLAFQDLGTDEAVPSLIHLNPTQRDGADPALYEEIARHWVNSSVMMQTLLQKQDALYFHIMQPNQYYTERDFSAEEARIALRPDSYYQPGVERGYPVLLAHVDQLHAEGINFYSALHIFDTEPQQVYIDDCCHYTQRGNDLLADFIAASILENFE